MDEWIRYAEIKKLVDENFTLMNGKRYEDFIIQLVKILEL